GPGGPAGRGLDARRGVDLRGRLRAGAQRAGPGRRAVRPVGRQGIRHRPVVASRARPPAFPHQPPGDHRCIRRLQRRAPGALLMRAVLLCALAASAARAASPGALSDPMFYLHEDTYQLTPRRLSQWEAGRLAQQGNAWVDLGSVEGGRYDAVERGVLNLELASRLSLHAELRNDLDAGGRVTRAVADLLVNVAPGLWLGASGVPAARKQDYGVGGSVLFASASRRRYLLARVVADQFLYNRTNVDGGTRTSPVLHAQVPGRWAAAAWSLAGPLDAATALAPAIRRARAGRRGRGRRRRHLVPPHAPRARRTDRRAVGGRRRTVGAGIRPRHPGAAPDRRRTCPRHRSVRGQGLRLLRPDL